jgi:hypothetical protein
MNLTEYANKSNIIFLSGIIPSHSASYLCNNKTHDNIFNIVMILFTKYLTEILTLMETKNTSKMLRWF